MMVLILKWYELFCEDPNFCKARANTRYSVTAFPYLPIVLSIENMLLRYGNLPRKTNLWEKRYFTLKAYGRSEVRETEEYCVSGDARELGERALKLFKRKMFQDFKCTHHIERVVGKRKCGHVSNNIRRQIFGDIGRSIRNMVLFQYIPNDAIPNSYFKNGRWFLCKNLS